MRAPPFKDDVMIVARRLLISASLLAFISLSGMAHAVDANVVVQPREHVARKSQVEWSVQWWQWAASFEYDESPVADPTGELCASGQKGDVWFLAGVYGSEPVKRRCQVPAGKALFFPIVNYILRAPEGNPKMGCDELTATAREFTDNPVDLTVVVDGLKIQNVQHHRQATEKCFDLGGRTSAGNGYYMMLKPLPPGRHVIQWGGVLGSARQAVAYEIEVAK
jgi:hypothetical protein